MSEVVAKEVAVAPLEYAGPKVGKRGQSLYGPAIVAGAWPLVAGVTITLLYLATEWRGLEVFGFLIFLLGLGSFGIGVLCLLGYWFFEWRAGGHSWRLYGRIVLALALLLSNFPAAVGCMVLSERVRSKHAVHVTNQGTTTISSFVLSGPGISQEIGPIGPGATVSHTFRFHDGAPLNFKAISGGTLISDTIDPYAHNNRQEWDVAVNGTTVVVKPRPLP